MVKIQQVYIFIEKEHLHSFRANSISICYLLYNSTEQLATFKQQILDTVLIYKVSAPMTILVLVSYIIKKNCRLKTYVIMDLI